MIVKENVPYLIQLCEDNKIPATYFEITTALAFLTYKQSDCDAVVLEVGLGGQHDATNVISKSLLSIITSIQLDHTKVPPPLSLEMLFGELLTSITMQFLGDTVEKIALNKAGIFKKDGDALVGPHCPMPPLLVTQ